MSVKKERFKVYDMTCGSCEKKVEKSIKSLEGVFNAIASFEQGTVIVEYETALCSGDKIKESIKKAGYSTEDTSNIKFIGLIAVVAAIIILGMFRGGIDMESKLKGASYLMLFVIGMFTSIHCVGMCGGIMLTQSMNKGAGDNSGLGNSSASAVGAAPSRFQAIKPALLYNLGRVISYTIIGGIIGALGSVMSLSTMTMALLQIFAGLFMIVMGSNLAGFSIFRKLNIRLPWSSCGKNKKPHAPLIVGLLNGLMPCGPLQTMQIYALGAGSAFAGALSMFMFSIGTVPLMLTFGAVSGLLSKGYTKKILKFSGILVIVLGLIMSGRGLALTGLNLNPMAALMSRVTSGGTSQLSGSAVVKPEIKDGVQIVRMTADGRGYNPRVIYIQKDMPVKWIIDGKQITSCNNQIVVPTYKIKQKLKSGENVIEFTPKDDKDIKFSCWMGMITGTFKVVDNIDTVDSSQTAQAAPPAQSGASCCGGGDPSTAQQSIYGDDLSQVPTDTLIKKVKPSNGVQTLTVEAIGYEFKPLIIVTGKDVKTRLTIDFNQFDNPEGTYTIMDTNSGDKITSFEGKKGIVTFEYTFKKVTGYAIIKDNIPLAIIDVVDNVQTADLENSRSKYLK